jgi:hypothetical protein
MKYQLREDHPLFRALETEDPAWWQNLKKDEETYCDIRKDNSINIYYNGGSILRLSYQRGYCAFIHPEYVPLEGEGEYLPVHLNGPTAFIEDPGIIDLQDFGSSALARIKKRIRNHFPRNSEKAIQGRYVTDQLYAQRRNGFFIDTEFEYSVRQKNGKWRIGRVDLVWVDRDSRQIVLVELKTRNDARIQPQNAGRTGAIEEQLAEYGRFLGDTRNRDALKAHYEKVYQIKKRLGLLSGFTKHPTLKDYTVADRPVLLVGDATQEWIRTQAGDLHDRITTLVMGLYCQGIGTNSFRIPKRGAKHTFGF